MSQATLEIPPAIRVPDEFTCRADKLYSLARWSGETGILLATLTAAAKSKQLHTNGHGAPNCDTSGESLLAWARANNVPIKASPFVMRDYERHVEQQNVKQHRDRIAAMDREACQFDAWGVCTMALAEWVGETKPTVHPLALSAAIAKAGLRPEDLLEHRAVFLKVRRILEGNALDCGELGRLRSEHPHVVQAAEKLFAK